MITVTMDEARARLSELVEALQQPDEEVMICRDGKPVAELTKPRVANRLTPHPVLSRIEIRYDPTEPLQSDEWPEECR